MVPDQKVTTNAGINGALLEEVATPDEQGRTLLNQAADRFKLTARGYHRILKVARTLADLEGSSTVRSTHIAEAIYYRQNTTLHQHAA